MVVNKKCLLRAVRKAVHAQSLRSDEAVRSETGTSYVGEAGGAAVFTLDWTPIRVGTLSGRIDGVKFCDNCNGQLVRTDTFEVIGTVHYMNGKVACPGLGVVDYVVDYHFDSTGDVLMTVPFTVVSSPIVANPLRLQTLRLQAYWDETPL